MFCNFASNWTYVKACTCLPHSTAGRGEENAGSLAFRGAGLTAGRGLDITRREVHARVGCTSQPIDGRLVNVLICRRVVDIDKREGSRVKHKMKYTLHDLRFVFIEDVTKSRILNKTCGETWY